MTLASLAPAGMIDLRVDVGVEAVLVGRCHVPGGARLATGEADLHDRLDALEAVFPGHDEPQRRTVLTGKSLAIEPDHHEGERMHRLVDAQSLHIGPGEDGNALTGHAARVVQRRELDVLRARCRLEARQQRAQGEADPRHNQGPGLDATEAIDALFERMRLENVLEGEFPLDLRLAIDSDAPALSLQKVRVALRVFLLRAELVEVVVARDLLELVRCLADGITGVARVVEAHATRLGLRSRQQGARSAGERRGQQGAAVEEHLRWGDLGWGNARRAQGHVILRAPETLRVAKGYISAMRRT